MNGSLEGKAALAGCVAAVLDVGRKLESADDVFTPETLNMLLELSSLLRKLAKQAG